LARRIGDRPGEAMLHNNLGSAGLASARPHEALRHAEQAARMFAELHEPVLHALALVNRAEAHRELGQYGPALDLGGRALNRLRKGGHRVGEATVQENLGLARLALGEHDVARGHLQAALALARDTGARSLEASTLLHLGQLEAAAGQPGEARGLLDGATTLAHELSLPSIADEAAVARAALALANPGGADAATALAAIQPLVDHLLQLPMATAQAADTLFSGIAPEDDPGPAVPLSLHMALAQVLQRAADPRAPALLARACDRLREQAARIDDATARRDFLNMAEHRALLDA
jgi:tetratricopeptide (TPR) repeat protein